MVSSAGGAAEAVNVARTRDAVPDARAIAVGERQLETHADERRQNVGEDDGRVEPEGADGLQCDLGGEFGRANDVEDAVSLAQGPVLRHVAPRLAHEPDRCALDRKPAAGSQEGGGGLRRRRALGAPAGAHGDGGADCHDAPHEERPQPLEVKRGLARSSHPLHAGGEREELRPEQPDHEVVVMLVEAMAREPDS